MKRMGAGRNLIATARIAFALMAPAVAGCAPSPRAPVSEACVSGSASLQEAQAVVESAILRMEELEGLLLDRVLKINAGVEQLGPAATYASQPMRYLLDTAMENAEGTLVWFKKSIESLRNGIAEAGEDAGMRMLALRACAMLEFSEINFHSAMACLDMVSAELGAVQKDLELPSCPGGHCPSRHAL